MSTNINLVLTSLRRIIRAADIHSKNLTKTAGLTAPQLLLMQAIENCTGDTSIGTLANQISLSQATVTSIITRLESRKLIIRERSTGDKRFVWLRLTDFGREVLANAPKPMQKHFIDRFTALGEWEQNMILSSLQRLAEMMDAEKINASPFLEVGALDKIGDLAKNDGDANTNTNALAAQAGLE